MEEIQHVSIQVLTLWSLICSVSLIISHQKSVAASYYAEAEPCGALADINSIYTARYDGTCKGVRAHRALGQVRSAVRPRVRALIGCWAAAAALVSWWNARWWRSTAAGGQMTGRMTGRLMIGRGIDWRRKTNVEFLRGARFQFILSADPSILSANRNMRTKRMRTKQADILCHVFV